MREFGNSLIFHRVCEISGYFSLYLLHITIKIPDRK